MVHATLTPSNTDIHITIPMDYVGKQIEVLLYATDEGKEKKVGKKKLSKLRGTLKLSDEQYKDFQKHVKKIRGEWDRSI